VVFSLWGHVTFKRWAIRTKRGYWLHVNGGQGGSIENVSSRKFQIWVVLNWHFVTLLLWKTEYFFFCREICFQYTMYNITLYDKNSESDYFLLQICNEANYPHDSALTKRFVVKITVERCDEFFVAVPQFFGRAKFVALWSAKKPFIINPNTVKWTLDITKGIIQKGHSRETGNIGQPVHVVTSI
jgi:hypothetical protein